jgi:replicative DNA helicase
MNDAANRALEAEQLIIGSLLQKPELLGAIDLGPGHFSSSVYEQAYRACEDLRMAGTPIDMISVWSWLADKHPSDEWGQRLGRVIEAAMHRITSNSMPIKSSASPHCASSRR